MKKAFMIPELELCRLSIFDVITASDSITETEGYGNDDFKLPGVTPPTI